MKCPLCKETAVIQDPDEEKFEAFDPEEKPWDYACRSCGYAWSDNDTKSQKEVKA
jgi:predicted Zn-ribbon and HTH transcriptional regulator